MQFVPTTEQEAILQHDPSRHARVLAGPGTGKSTTTVALLNRLRQGNKSLRVKMLTFTRAATAELAKKVSSQPEGSVRPSTIHSFAISLLLQNAGAGGFPEPLRIADTWEFKNIVRPTLAKRAGTTLKLLNKLIQEMGSNWESLTDEVEPEINETDRIRFRGAWHEHRQIMGYTLLQELPYALYRALCNHDDLDGTDFDLLLVDEYQDLNACDLAVLKLLCERSGSTVIGIGDDDQSIYSWRKAAPEGIRRFLNDYPAAIDYPLSVTQRCGKRIIQWANYVIQGDPDRPANRTVLDPAPNSPEGKVALLRFKGEKAEAKGIAHLVQNLVHKEEIEPKEILILMRSDNNGTFSKPIREQLEKIGVPCSDPNYIQAILDGKNNRRLIEMLRLLIDPNDSISWASILHLTDGVGESFFSYIYDRAKQKGSTFSEELFAAREQSFPGAPSSGRKVMTEVDQLLAWLKAKQVPAESPMEGWGRWIMGLVGDESYVPSPTLEFRNLLFDLDELSETGQSLGRYLGQVEPLGKDLAQSRSEGVRIMTMGGSKGLTVRATIIAGVEDGLVPRPRADLSEERRILYVAMTRAKEYLFCTWANQRRGPTARAGKGNMNRRHYSHFLQGGPIKSTDGLKFLEDD
jgi:DNA helicase II / ATP-dependent DNA helicase PcrA